MSNGQVGRTPANGTTGETVAGPRYSKKVGAVVMHMGSRDIYSTTPNLFLRLAARVVAVVLLAVCSLTISSGDARAIVLEGDHAHGVSAVTSSGTRYISATALDARVARAASLTSSHLTSGGPQEY